MAPDDEELLSSLSENRRVLLENYVDALLEANSQFNLTAIRDRTEAWERHILESLRLSPHLGNPKTLLDVGSGGGLPGIVLAIARPEIQVTLLEATGKKARFLEATKKALGLSNVSVICDRAENAGSPDSELRESFDLVTARAVAPLRTLLELTVPFAKPGRNLLLVKGDRADGELREATNALRILDVNLTKKERVNSGTLLFLKKGGTTPKKYPRRSGEPKRNPL